MVYSFGRMQGPDHVAPAFSSIIPKPWFLAVAETHGVLTAASGQRFMLSGVDS